MGMKAILPLEKTRENPPTMEEYLRSTTSNPGEPSETSHRKLGSRVPFQFTPINSPLLVETTTSSSAARILDIPVVTWVDMLVRNKYMDGILIGTIDSEMDPLLRDTAMLDNSGYKCIKILSHSISSGFECINKIVSDFECINNLLSIILFQDKLRRIINDNFIEK